VHILYIEYNTRSQYFMGFTNILATRIQLNTVQHISLRIQSIYNKQSTATRHRYLNNNTIKLLLCLPLNYIVYDTCCMFKMWSVCAIVLYKYILKAVEYSIISMERKKIINIFKVTYTLSIVITLIEWA